MPRDPYIREKYTREISHARKLARDYFERYPKELYETEVESWADIQAIALPPDHPALFTHERGIAVDLASKP